MIRFKKDDGSDYPKWEEKINEKILVEARLGGNYSNKEEKNNKPLIKMGNIGRGNIVLDKIEYIQDDEEPLVEDILKEGDLLFNTRNTLDLVGKVAIWNNEIPLAYYNSNLLRLKYDDSKIVNNNFMNYVFNSYNIIKELRRIATGSTSVAAIYTKDFNKIKFFIPNSLEEQQKIADFLSSVDDVISSSEQEVKELEELKKGSMQKIFNQEVRFKKDDGSEYPEWEEKKLSSLCNMRGRIGFRGYNESDLSKENTGYITLSPSDFIEGKVNFSNPTYITKEKYEESPEIMVKENDILFTKTASIGKNAFIKKLPMPLTINPQILLITAKDCVPYYLFLFMCTDKAQRYVNHIIGGSTIKTLSQEELKLMKIDLPCLEEQQKIADFLSEIDNAINYAKEELECWKELKKGLLQQLFE